MSHIENIRKGSYIIITGKKPSEPPTISSQSFEAGGIGIMPIPIPMQPQAEYEADGIPQKVIAVQPPFILITDTEEERIGSVDTRNYTVILADPKYVANFKKHYNLIKDKRRSPTQSRNPMEIILSRLQEEMK